MVTQMRVCIYKADEAPDLTLFLREGLAIPGGTEEINWTQFKTVTQGELKGDLLARMELSGYCLVRLGRLFSEDRATQSSKAPSTATRLSYWRRFPNAIRRIAGIGRFLPSHE